MPIIFPVKKNKKHKKSAIQEMNPTTLPEEYMWHDYIETFVIKLNYTIEQVLVMNYKASLKWLAMWKAKYDIELNKQNK